MPFIFIRAIKKVRRSLKARGQTGTFIMLMLLLAVVILALNYSLSLQLTMMMKKSVLEARKVSTRAGFNMVTDVLAQKWVMREIATELAIGQQFINQGPKQLPGQGAGATTRHTNPSQTSGGKLPGGDDGPGDGGGGGGGSTSLYGVFGDRVLAGQPPFTIDEIAAMYDRVYTITPFRGLDPGPKHFDDPRAQRNYDLMREQFQHVTAIVQAEVRMDWYKHVSELGLADDPKLSPWVYRGKVYVKVVTEEETTLVALDDPPAGSEIPVEWSPTYGRLESHPGQPPLQGSYLVPDDAWCLLNGFAHRDGFHWVKLTEFEEGHGVNYTCDCVSNEVPLPETGLLATINQKPVNIQRTKLMEGGQYKVVAGQHDVLGVPGLVAPIKRIGTGQKKGRYSGTFQFEIQLRFAKPDGTNFVPPSEYLPSFERELDPIEVEQGCLVKVENPDGEHDVLHDRSVIQSCGGMNSGQVLASGLSLSKARNYLFFFSGQPSSTSSLKRTVKFKPGQWQNNVLTPNPDSGGGDPNVNPGQSYTLVSVRFSKGNMKSLPQFVSIE